MQFPAGVDTGDTNVLFGGHAPFCTDASRRSNMTMRQLFDDGWRTSSTSAAPPARFMATGPLRPVKRLMMTDDKRTPVGARNRPVVLTLSGARGSL